MYGIVGDIDTTVGILKGADFIRNASLESPGARTLPTLRGSGSSVWSSMKKDLAGAGPKKWVLSCFFEEGSSRMRPGYQSCSPTLASSSSVGRERVRGSLTLPRSC
jgi:hypothetical protein